MSRILNIKENTESGSNHLTIEELQQIKVLLLSSVDRKDIEIELDYELIPYDERLRKLSGVRLSFTTKNNPTNYQLFCGKTIKRRINVKGGAIDLKKLQQKINELTLLQAQDLEKSKATEEFFLKKKEQEELFLSKARSLGLKLTDWTLKDKTFVLKDRSFTPEQAKSIQDLLDTFN